MGTTKLEGRTREIAEAISAEVRRVASADRRDATIAEMASAVEAMLCRAELAASA